MSLANNPEDKPKPVLKDKNPHNYRKVGYCMILISVSLVVILLLSWALASDYHFSSNIMALQEVDTMTPKAGYNIVLFDISQPVGAKLKILDHADTLDAAQQLQSQDATQNPGSTIQVLIFNSTEDYNLNQMIGAEVFLQTPKTGYNVVFDNYNLAVGAKLTSGSYQASLANATAYENQAQEQIQGLDEKILIFSSSFTDNLKMMTNSSTPVTNYTLVLPPSLVSSAPQTSTNQTTQVASSSGSNATAVVPSQVQSNKTTTVAANKTAVTATNQTTTVAANAQVTISKGASLTNGTCSATTCFNPNVVNVNVGGTVTWTNADTVGHTATSGKLSDNTTGTVWDSSLIKAGGTYTSPPFATAGTYNYFCQVHPWMTGQVIVGAGSATSSPTTTAPSGSNMTSMNTTTSTKVAMNATVTTITSKSVSLNETLSLNATGK
jgi:plastocyanin